jgi:hypothetical protein
MKRENLFVEDPALQRAGEVLADLEAPTIDLRAEYAILAGHYKQLLHRLFKTVSISDSFEALHRESTSRIEEATAKYRQLKRIDLPICMYCKRVRSDDEYWQRLETFFWEHADILFSHGICPECIRTAYSKVGMELAGISPSPTMPATESSQLPSQPVAEDDTLARLRDLVSQCARDNNPLTKDLKRFAERYEKLLHRFLKTVTISDGYQSQLLALKAQMGNAATPKHDNDMESEPKP